MGQKLLREWFHAVAPGLFSHYEERGWKCSISERQGNEFVCWKNNTEVIRKFQMYASSRTKEEVQDHEKEAFLKAVSEIGGKEKPYFMAELDPLAGTYGVHQATTQCVQTVLVAWRARQSGPMRPVRPKATRISGPYFRPKEGEEPNYMECGPIADEKADEAKELLFAFDPTAKPFVQMVEGSSKYSMQDKLDVKCYMEAVVQNKDRIADLVGIQEYMQDAKRAQVGEDEVMGVNSPRPK